jgi:hypothetical protein
MNENAFDIQLRAFREALTGPEGIIGGVLLVLLLVLLLMDKRVKWGVIGLMLWMATLSYYVEALTLPETLVQPLNTLRAFGRPLTVTLLFSLLLVTITSTRGWRRRLLGPGVLALFFFEMVFAFRTAAGGVVTRGVLNLVLYPLLFTIMAWGVSRWLQDWRDARALIRTIVWAGLIFLAGTGCQLLFNPSAIVHANRLYSTTGNPQHAALVIAIALPSLCYTIVNKQEWKIWRLILGVATGFLVLLLIWTGSRTGLIVAAVGVVLLFRARLGKLALTSIIVGLSVWLAMQIYTESTLSIAGMFARGDTRTRAWVIWWQQFLDNKAWGVMSEQYGTGENSYLTTAAQTGLVGLIPLFIAVVATIWQLVRLQRLRRYLGEYIMMADLVTAGLVAIGVGAIFEGYLLGALTMPVFCIYLYLALATFLLDAVEFSQSRSPGWPEWEAVEEYAQQEHELAGYDPVGIPAAHHTHVHSNSTA